MSRIVEYVPPRQVEPERTMPKLIHPQSHRIVEVAHARLAPPPLPAKDAP